MEKDKKKRFRKIQPARSGRADTGMSERDRGMNNGKNFDMEGYINKRMLEIESLEERKLYKEIVGKILLEINNYNRNAYQTLEKTILSEHKTQQNDFAVYLTLTDLRHYDATDGFMHPMIPEDTKEHVINTRNVTETLSAGAVHKLFTVFLKTGASDLYRLVHGKRRFYGVVQTDKSRYNGEFSLSRNERYMDMIKELYHIFGVNYQPYMTVCEAYLTKMFDVCVSSLERIPEKEEIREITINFEEYAENIHYNMIPMWNLERKTEKTSTYPDACIDKINYEHRIFSNRLKDGCGYLVMNTDIEIMDIRRVKGDLVISCPMDIPCKWKLYQVNKRNGKENYPYPVLSNQPKESFAGSLVEMYRRSIKTKAEMARMMEAFPYSRYVVFRDFEILDREPEELRACNYNMDGFIVDEIRIGSLRQYLVLSFMVMEQGNFLNEDIMSFLVTQVQKLFPEYICVGKLV